MYNALLIVKTDNVMIKMVYLVLKPCTCIQGMFGGKIPKIYIFRAISFDWNVLPTDFWCSFQGYTRPCLSHKSRWPYGQWPYITHSICVDFVQFFGGRSFLKHHIVRAEMLLDPPCTEQCRKSGVMFARFVGASCDGRSAKLSCKCHRSPGSFLDDIFAV